jgi:diaminopimelate decarboxylase
VLTAAELAARYGTPLYVYRLDRVRRAATELRAALPDGTRLYYSLKANSHPRLVAELRAQGLAAEVSSVGELSTALDAGHPAADCLYTGPGKTREEVVRAIALGVRLFSVESAADRDRVAAAAVAAGVEVHLLVRLNGGAVGASGLRMTGRSSQFGVGPAAAEPVLDTTVAGVRPVGLHLFPATNVPDEDVLAAEFELSIRTAAETMDRVGLAPELIDVGGGFTSPFARPGRRPEYPKLRDALERSLDTYLPGWRVGAPTVAFESGRYLVGDCGTLLTTVLDVKDSRGTRFVVLDAGINVLGGMGGTGRLLTAPVQPVGTRADAAAATLTGPLCTPLDVLARDARVDVDPGSVLEIPNVGAYGLSASLVAFLGRPIAAEVVLDGVDIVAARRLELRAADISNGSWG